MENQGASSPGILILTTSLSKPFMRLEKYVTLLQELERHMEVREGELFQACVPSMVLCSGGRSQFASKMALQRNQGLGFKIYFICSSLFSGF